MSITTTKYFEKKCHFENQKDFIPCTAMNILLNSTTMTGQGVSVCHTINLKTGEEADRGVYFKTTKKVAEEYMDGKTKIMFNSCPFCEEKILRK
jgi:hypothetical protein